MRRSACAVKRRGVPARASLAPVQVVATGKLSLAAVEVMKLSEPGKQVAACGRLAKAVFVNWCCELALRSALGGLESVL